ncbi:hybrid sensor histidine kinase/response regulator, partial [Paenibacillus sepulcri]|nr:hybrid sensor histidine kinase/response regulator [Paenibacillus sepulcri]
DAEQREYAEIIHRSGDALLLIINDILDYAKIESGKLELEEAPFRLDLIIAETFELFTAKSKQFNLELAASIDSNLPSQVVGDGSKLRQILINLVGNAVKFTPQGSILITVKLLRERERSIDIEFSVQDTGVGIPENKQPLLFRPFSQVDTSLTRQYSGTGLGLAICKNLVELMGGSIRVESVVDVGSVFRFTVTLRLEADRHSELAHPFYSGNETAAARESMEPASVLVADDNEINQKLTLRLLDKMGIDAD